MKVYITFVRADLSVASKLAAHLTKHDYQVTLNDGYNLGSREHEGTVRVGSDIHHGKHWESVAKELVDEASVVVAILTPQSVRSTGVMRELRYARSRNKKLVLLRAPDLSVSESPLELSRIT